MIGNLAVIIIGVVGAGLVLFLYNLLVVKTKKVTGEWVAEVYTSSSAVKDVDKMSVNDLKLHSIDKLRKVELKGSVIYSLVSLGKTTPAVTEDVEETTGYDGKKPLKRVRVLLQGDSCTLLSVGLHGNLVVFSPISYDKNNQIQNDILLHESRHRNKESFWNQIAPFLNILVVSLMVIIATMLIGNTQAQISEENTVQLQSLARAQEVISENIAIANLIANGFSASDLNSLKESIVDVRVLADGDPSDLGRQKIYKDNVTIPILE